MKTALLGVAGAGLFLAGVVLAKSSHSEPSQVVTTPSGRTYVAPPPVHMTERDRRDPDPVVRARALAQVTDSPTLLEASRDPSPEIGLRATAELGKLYANGELPASELIARIRDRSLDEKVRGMAMNGLGMVRAPEAAALFVDQLAHGEPVERRTAAVLLMNQDEAVAVPALIAALGDGDEYVASNANEALVHLARGKNLGMDANAWRSYWQSRNVRP